MMVVLSTVAAAGSAISPLSMLESIGLLVIFPYHLLYYRHLLSATFFKKNAPVFQRRNTAYRFARLMPEHGGAGFQNGLFFGTGRLFNGHFAFWNHLHAPHQGFARAGKEFVFRHFLRIRRHDGRPFRSKRQPVYNYCPGNNAHYRQMYFYLPRRYAFRPAA